MGDYDKDFRLSIAGKLYLIRSIKHWQRKRWKRLRFWHGTTMPIKDKHFFMMKEIELLRSQKARLHKLEQSILQ